MANYHEPRLYPVSYLGVVLKGGRFHYLCQVWGGDSAHYLVRDCESWTDSILKSGAWNCVAGSLTLDESKIDHLKTVSKEV